MDTLLILLQKEQDIKWLPHQVLLLNFTGTYLDGDATFAITEGDSDGDAASVAGTDLTCCKSISCIHFVNANALMQEVLMF